MEYTDGSYPPIGSQMRYQRSDGAIISLEVLPGDAPPPATLPAALYYQQGLTELPVGSAPRSILPLLPANPTTALSEVADDRYTIFVLVYGDFYDLHKRCLDGILATVPQRRLDLRIGSNQLCQASLSYVEDLVQRGFVSKHYRHPNNDRKYPVMREMFWDESHPIQTKWVIWFDDDSIVVDQNWIAALDNSIKAAGQQHPPAQMLGAKFSFRIDQDQANFIRTRPWYRGKQFRIGGGKPAPNGDKVFFATGGHWAITLEAIRSCGIPDTELLHNGGDWLIGEQLYQNDFPLFSWNSTKQYVTTSSVARRGLSEPPIGNKHWQALKRTVNQ